MVLVETSIDQTPEDLQSQQESIALESDGSTCSSLDTACRNTLSSRLLDYDHHNNFSTVSLSQKYLPDGQAIEENASFSITQLRLPKEASEGKDKINDDEDLHQKVQELEAQVAAMNENINQLLKIGSTSKINAFTVGILSSLEGKSSKPNYEQELRNMLEALDATRKEANGADNLRNSGEQICSNLPSHFDASTSVGEAPLTDKNALSKESSARAGDAIIRKRTMKESTKEKSEETVLDTSTPSKERKNILNSEGNCDNDVNIPTTLSSLFQSLNLDSLQQDGSATKEVDANMDEFVRVPYKLEVLLFFGLAICVDSFLHVLTVFPLKFAWSCLSFVCTIIRPKTGIGGCCFHRRHMYQLIRGFVIYATYYYCLSPISIGKLYHWIRGQEMLKLYVLMAMVEVFDRLMCSLGQDALDSLYWNTTRRPYHPRMVISVAVVLCYAMIHSMILLMHVATLNVAMNSSDQALLSLLIGGNFAEIKTTVFKNNNKRVLFKITSSDICERFKLMLFLGLILLLNCTQGGDKNMVNDYVIMACIIMVAEMICDWIKHSFITKLNFIKSSTYRDYALILAGDITGVGHEGVNIDHTHAVVKRLGFAQIPLACVMARYIREAARYADILADAGDANHVLYPIAFVYAHGSLSLVSSILLAVFVFFLLLKMLLGLAVNSVARNIIVFASYDERNKLSVSTEILKSSSSKRKKV